MNNNDKIFSCAEIIDKKINRITLCFAILILALFAANCVFNFMLYKDLKKKIFYTYYRNIEVTEQIHNVQIDNYGKVSPNIINQKNSK